MDLFGWSFFVVVSQKSTVGVEKSGGDRKRVDDGAFHFEIALETRLKQNATKTRDKCSMSRGSCCQSEPPFSPLSLVRTDSPCWKLERCDGSPSPSFAFNFPTTTKDLEDIKHCSSRVSSQLVKSPRENKSLVWANYARLILPVDCP